jgi:hypothetical protein
MSAIPAVVAVVISGIQCTTSIVENGSEKWRMD